MKKLLNFKIIFFVFFVKKFFAGVLKIKMCAQFCSKKRRILTVFLSRRARIAREIWKFTFAIFAKIFFIMKNFSPKIRR